MNQSMNSLYLLCLYPILLIKEFTFRIFVIGGTNKPYITGRPQMVSEGKSKAKCKLRYISKKY